MSETSVSDRPAYAAVDQDGICCIVCVDMPGLGDEVMDWLRQGWTVHPTTVAKARGKLFLPWDTPAPSGPQTGEAPPASAQPRDRPA